MADTAVIIPAGSALDMELERAADASGSSKAGIVLLALSEWLSEQDEIAEVLSRIDRGWQRRILAYLEMYVANAADPNEEGKALSGPLAGYWRYRVGDYRVICDLDDGGKVVRVVRVGHQRNLYV